VKAVQVDVRRAYALVKPLIEEEALALKARNPWLHLADACTAVHRRRPLYWRIYRAAMAPDVRCPSEFQRARRPPGRLKPKHRAWNVIEDLARTLVAASREPLTLRDAVGHVVRANPRLYEQYSNAKHKS
jgi:hypothetical protein